MNGRLVLGTALLSVPFVGVFAMIFATLGVAKGMLALGFTAVSVTCTWVGMHLLDDRR